LQICFLEFQNAGGLAKHMSIHYFVRRFVCAICRHHFESRQEMQLHRRQNMESCGRVDYVDSLGNVGQLVAIDEPKASLQTDLLCDVEIKTEPLDTADEQIEQQPQLSNVTIKTEPIEKHEEFRPSRDATWPSVSGSSLTEQLRGKLRLPAIKKPLKSEFAPKIQALIHSNPAIQCK